jgi:hypothetical protein
LRISLIGIGERLFEVLNPVISRHQALLGHTNLLFERSVLLNKLPR